MVLVEIFCAISQAIISNHMKRKVSIHWSCGNLIGRMTRQVRKDMALLYYHSLHLVDRSTQDKTHTKMVAPYLGSGNALHFTGSPLHCMHWIAATLGRTLVCSWLAVSGCLPFLLLSLEAATHGTEITAGRIGRGTRTSEWEIINVSGFGFMCVCVCVGGCYCF